MTYQSRGEGECLELLRTYNSKTCCEWREGVENQSKNATSYVDAPQVGDSCNLYLDANTCFHFDYIHVDTVNAKMEEKCLIMTKSDSRNCAGT